jgi:hypothetical protein
MSERPVHPSAGEVAEDGVEVVRDAGTDAMGVVVPGVSSEPSEPKRDETDKVAKEKES